MSKSPIFDLSYRNTRAMGSARLPAWMSIATTALRKNLKNRWCWSLAGFSCYFYLIIAIFSYVVEQQMSQNMGARSSEITQLLNLRWPDQFAFATGFQQIFILFITLICGAGAIANDVKANALLVYFSKPMTKFEYVLGKWLGVFSSLLIFILTPNLIFYLYCMVSYQDYGIWSQDKLIFFKMVLWATLTAAMYSGLVVGISSLSRSGRAAGVLTAAIYLITNFFTLVIPIQYVMQLQGNSRVHVPLIGKIMYHCSIDGASIGLAKGLYDYQGRSLFSGGRQDPLFFGAPPLYLSLLATIGLTALMLFVTYRRVRPVEVV